MNYRNGKSIGKNMTKILLLAVTGMFILSSVAMAEKATTEEMNNVSQNWIASIVNQEGNWNGSLSPKIESFEDIIIDGDIAGRIYNVAPSGFIVVPILKEMPVVAFYSTKTNLDLKDPDGTADIVKTILGHRVKVFKDYYGSLESSLSKSGDNIFGTEDRAKWDIFAVPEEQFPGVSGDFQKDTQDVAPLLTTTWHQGYPYNMYCPMGDGGRSVTGCVATAAAQIMWYYQWPPIGDGSHTYYWGGDYCTGLGGGNLTANFWDVYDFSVESSGNVAELCYEVGVAYDMDYGNCASGAYLSGTPDIFPDYFRYKNSIIRRNRYQFTPGQWFTLIKNDLDLGHPILYGITQHAVVCDGWKYESSYNQYHMNYGWGGSQNYWYVLDSYYCPVSSCSQYDEQIYTGIVPDKDIMLYSDVQIGPAPLTVNFEGYSAQSVDSWDWTFGDGAVGTAQYPNNEYTDPGIYSVDLQIHAGGDVRNITAQNYVVATADTMKAENIEAVPGDTITLVVNIRNTAPLKSIRIPIEYDGDIALKHLGFSTVGCRTEYFEVQQEVKDPWNKTATYILTCSNYGSSPDLDPGYGPVVEVEFEVLSGNVGDVNTVLFDGYSSYQPTFSSFYGNYTPELIFPQITITFICGDVNGDRLVNLLDVLHLIDWKFKQGPPPEPMEAANVNGDELINLLDILYLIDYKFKEGPAPNCP